MPDYSAIAAQNQKLAREKRVADLDISEAYDEPPGTTVWQFEELDVPKLFLGAETAGAMAEKFPDFTEELRLKIALLASSHRGPALPQGTSPAQFFAGMVHNARAWSLLLRKHAEAFPELSQMATEEAVEAAKKNSPSKPARARAEARSSTSSAPASKNSTATPPIVPMRAGKA
jgi:hypothetical protein